MKANDLAAKAIGVKNIPTGSLKPNPHNPRLLFDRADLEVLRDSIDRVGILVPLTVYRESRTGDYRILDGQRRWMCAEELHLKSVPVNEVAEPTLVQNIVTMFQIHRLRKDWELMPTALKVELLMRELREAKATRLAELTALPVAVIVRCKKLLSYRKRYQDMMLDPDPAKRLKADFFIELYSVRNDRTVNRFSWFKKDAFTDAMLRKFEAKGLKAVTDFRLVKQYITNAANAGKTSVISNRLREFTETPELGPSHLNIESAQVASQAKKLVNSIDKLFGQIESIDVEDYYGEEAMWAHLEKLAKLIRAKLRSLGRRVDQ
jgi:ParB family chromosome partitioning protein